MHTAEHMSPQGNEDDFEMAPPELDGGTQGQDTASIFMMDAAAKGSE